MKRLIRNIMYWAFELEPDECFGIVGGEWDVLPEDEAERTAAAEGYTPGLYFCRARPSGVPDAPPEHVHQTPNVEADKERVKEFGWMVSDMCIIPNVEFTLHDANGQNAPSSVTMRTDGGL